MLDHSSIVVVGAGYVGLATGVFLADRGFSVTMIDKNPHTLDLLNRGRLPFREPLLQKKYRQVLKINKINNQSPDQGLYVNASFIFIAIDSANPETGLMRMKDFKEMAAWIGNNRTRKKLTVVLKSTNTIGFAEKFHNLLDATPYGDKVNLVVNPEFLREGYAFEDTMHPWRIVIGAGNKKAASNLIGLYRTIHKKTIPMIITDWKSAELIKLASNVYLSHRLSFIHEIADFVRLHKLDLKAVKDGIGLDPRIGLNYFEPGLGFGGSCLPKDCLLLNTNEYKNKFEFKTARTALEINRRVLDLLINKLQDNLGSLQGKKIAILGMAFKPGIDDTRNSQAVKLALKLKRCKARIAVFDPYLRKEMPIADGSIKLEDDLISTLKSTSAIIIGTAHRQFRNIKPEDAAKIVKKKIISDNFGIVNQSRWEKEGFEFI